MVSHCWAQINAQSATCQAVRVCSSCTGGLRNSLHIAASWSLPPGSKSNFGLCVSASKPSLILVCWSKSVTVGSSSQRWRLARTRTHNSSSTSEQPSENKFRAEDATNGSYNYIRQAPERRHTRWLGAAVLYCCCSCSSSRTCMGSVCTGGA